MHLQKCHPLHNLHAMQENLYRRLYFMKREDVFAVLPTGCGKSLIFQLVPKVCSYLHDRGFSYPKPAIVVVICPLNALIDS